MTNREYFKNELDELLGERIAVNEETREPVRCNAIACERCLFRKKCSGYERIKLFKEWLNLEYIEPIKTIKASELAVDTKVICWDYGDNEKYKEHFAGLKDGILYAFSNGRTSWTTEYKAHWQYMSLEDGTVVLAE